MCAQCRMETVFGSVERKAVKTEVSEQQVVSSAPMFKQSAFTHSFIDQSITYILSFSFIQSLLFTCFIKSQITNIHPASYHIVRAETEVSAKHIFQLSHKKQRNGYYKDSYDILKTQ